MAQQLLNRGDLATGIQQLRRTGVTYSYTDALHKHAVTTLNGVQKFWYDANGNTPALALRTSAVQV